MHDGRMPSSAASVLSELSYVVEGMDCASCVQKVERAVSQLPGAQDVQSNFTTQTLRLRLDEAQTPRGVMERQLRALGYVPHRLTGEQNARATAEAGLSPARPWYASGMGRLVLTSGMLLLGAWLLSLRWPDAGQWGYVAATLLGTWPLARRAVAAARLGEPFSIHTLVTLAALGALLIGEAAEGAAVVVLFAVGELLESVAAGRARAGVQALIDLTPRTALLLTGEEVQEVAAHRLRPGQRVQVRPGARVPADGVIEAGRSALDESPVTGESIPVEREVGARVYAGSVNGPGTLTVRVDRAASDNTIARIIHLVEAAEGSKAPTARLINRFSRGYTPLVLAGSLAVATLPPLLAGGDWHTWLYRGLSLLLIGCPCALVLSVPAAITSALAAGTRRGLLIKGGAVLEALGRVQTVALTRPVR